MITNYHAVREVSKLIAKAVEHSVIALKEGRVEQEPAMTDRMLGAIEEAVDGFRAKGILWRAKTLTDRGRNSQESQYGADFMGVLNINLPEYVSSKGFLAQAKLVRNGTVNDITELKQQCRRMLAYSTQSFVFLYSTQHIRVISAVAVLAASDPLALYYRSAQKFFEEHLQCFIGDMFITSSTAEQLRNLELLPPARRALLVSAESAT